MACHTVDRATCRLKAQVGVACPGLAVGVLHFHSQGAVVGGRVVGILYHGDGDRKAALGKDHPTRALFPRVILAYGYRHLTQMGETGAGNGNPAVGRSGSPRG